MTDKSEYRGYFADCYVLTNKRTKQFVHSYLDKFLPNRQENADQYELPQYSATPTIIFSKADELIDHLEKKKSDNHTIYWSNKDKSDIRGLMCFFTNDGQLIVGLYCETKYPDTSIEDKYYKELQNFCNSGIGYVAYEEPAPHDSAKFLERAKKYKT